MSPAERPWVNTGERCAGCGLVHATASFECPPKFTVTTVPLRPGFAGPVWDPHSGHVILGVVPEPAPEPAGEG